MPAKNRTAHVRHESDKLLALAFNDAVRDILRADGRFVLGDDAAGNAVWQWDGARWERIPLDSRHADEPPFIEVERDEDLAVAG